MRSACILACLLFESFVNAQQLQWFAPGNPSPFLHGPWVYDSERDRLVLAGGYSEVNRFPIYFRDTLEWDGVGWLARPSTSFPGRWGQQMAFDPRRRRIVMFGGLNQFRISLDTPPYPLGDTWEYDGLQWRNRSTIGPSPRTGAAMIYDPVLQRVLLHGGSDLNNVNSETWAWDGTHWTMLNVAGPPARAGPASAYDTVRNRWVIFGGGNVTWLSDLWEWDGVAWTQRTPVVSPPPLLGGAGMAYDPLRRVCVLGGGFTSGGYPNPNTDLWEWDGTSWAQPAVQPVTHGGGMAAWHAGRGAVMFFDGAHLDSWDGQTFRSLNDYFVPGAIPRSRSSAQILLATLGPRVLAVTTDTLWEWSFPTWRFVETLPYVSEEIIAVEDTVRNRVVYVLPTGVGPSFFLAEFDGTTWNRMSRGSMPFSPRISPAIAFDRIRGVTVMFGGRQPSSPFQLLQETWEWNGSVFVQRVPATSPSPRLGAAMCWDPQLGEILLFGGDDFSPPLQDTWAWNGTNWHQLAPATQPPAVAMKLVLHESENRPWLFQSSPPGSGAWRWDGVDWQPVATSTGAAMVFDRARDQFLSIGYSNNVPTTVYLAAFVPQVTARGVGCGPPTVFLASTPFIGNPALRFDAFGLPAQSLGAVALGTQAANIGFGNGCTLLVGGSISVQLFPTNGGGFGSMSISVPAAPSLLGLQFHAQAFGVEAATATLVATSAQDLTIGY